MALFGDIGKGARDVLGGHSYDHKVTATSTVQGVPSTFTAVLKPGASQPALEAKFTGKAHGANLDVLVADLGKKLTLTAAVDKLRPGLKVTATGTLTEGAPGAPKVTGVYNVPGFASGTSLVFKSEAVVAYPYAKKVDQSVAYVHGPATVGAEWEFDTTKMALGKYTVGAQYALKQGTAALLLADKLDTAKLSYVHKQSSTLSFAAEVVHKISKNATTGSVGATNKFDAFTGKALLTSDLLVSLSATGDVVPKSVSGTACIQLDGKNISSKGPKYGVQLSVKA